jgi:magnesium transporter
MTDKEPNHSAPATRDDPLHAQRVGHYLVANVPTAGLDESAATVRERLIGKSFDDASHVFVLNKDGGLAGVVEMRELLAAGASTPLSELMTPGDCHIVSPETDREDAVSTAIRTEISSLPVCDASGRFIGAVPATAMMSILRDEHLEDLHHMVGILGRSESAQAALTASPPRRALFRLPWLLVGMAGSALATAMMAHFETALAAHIAVAFFVPAVVYLADAVGTQSEAVAVRAISLTGADLIPLLAGELGTGILIGTALSAIAFPLILFAFSNVALAATVSLALVAASSIATTIGFMLPWLFARLGYDPALGSGPLATVIQDVLSILIYFLVAAWLVF